mgnify:CR=1 FL=1
MKLGDSLPEFNLKNQEGYLISSTDLKGKDPLVIYFYPKNFTPGCNREACGFRDSFEEFSAKGAQVIGISADSVASHQKFASYYKLPFILLSDSKNEVRKLFGVKSNLLGILPGRETFVFNKEGNLTFKFKSMGADAHIEKALKHI